MADDGADDAPEGWGVRHRVAIIAALTTPVTLAVLLVLGGWFYNGELKPPSQPVHRFPAPGVELYIHEGALDPHRPAPRPKPDPAIEAAKRIEASAGWGARP